MEFRSLMPFTRGGLASRSGDTDPFASFRREIDRMFEDFGRGWNLPSSFGSSDFMSPKVDVAESEKGIEVTAELPGIDPKAIELDLTDNVLTLRAEHKAEKEEKDEKKHYHMIERSRGTFLRRLALPFEADMDKVEANFENGILNVLVPRSAAAEKQGKKIAVKGA